MKINDETKGKCCNTTAEVMSSQRISFHDILQAKKKKTNENMKTTNFSDSTI